MNATDLLRSEAASIEGAAVAGHQAACAAAVDRASLDLARRLSIRPMRQGMGGSE